MDKINLQKNINSLFEIQLKANQEYRSIKYRKKLIQKILDWMVMNEAKIKDTINKDFKKPDTEIELTEIWFCIKEARYILKNLNRWMKKKRVSKTLALLSTKSHIISEPKGIVLIIAPWNYPFQLSIMPLISAIASGNSIFLKPSEKTPNVSSLINSMVLEIFKPEDVTVFEGGEETVSLLLKKKFNHIFYTGGTDVGKIIMEKASHNLIPVTLELGGKCPVIIDSSANIEQAVKKITYFKFMNAGQTCVAPDYILIDEKVKKDFINHAKEYIEYMYGNIKSIENNQDYGRIVNLFHTKRLIKILKESLGNGSKLEFGGNYNEEECFISPTIIQSNFNSPIMKEEIFGPILPIITYKDWNEAINNIRQKESPLAAYIFSTNKKRIHSFINKTQSGGVCINDISLHLIHDKLPFGGVGHSGIGKYHGKYGFDEFSNLRPIVKNIDNSPLKMLHPPYTKKVSKFVKILKKLI